MAVGRFVVGGGLSLVSAVRRGLAGPRQWDAEAAADGIRRSLGMRWARWATRRRAPILWSALLVGIAAAPIAARLPLHGDMSYLLPPQTQSVRDLHALEGRAQVFGTIIVAIESDDPERRAAAARLVRDRLAALPAGTLVGIAADSAARDRFVWDHRHLLVPTEDLTAIRDELAQRKARLNPLFVALDDDDARRGAAGRAVARRSAARAETAARRRQGRRRTPDAARLEGRPPADHRRADAVRLGRGVAQRARPRRGRARGRRGPPGRRRRRCVSGSPATWSTTRRSTARCSAGWCERPCSRW